MGDESTFRWTFYKQTSTTSPQYDITKLLVSSAKRIELVNRQDGTIPKRDTTLLLFGI